MEYVNLLVGTYMTAIAAGLVVGSVIGIFCAVFKADKAGVYRL